jgi:phospholipid/cholesterol/gamma-HCH transport system substrate-binding protein
MVRETYALLTGLFVVVLGAVLIAVALFLGDYGNERDVYIVSTQGAVSGLNPESLVIYRGVRAGKVVSIQFDPKDSRNILVRIELDKGLPITHGTYATLRVQPLTGLAQIELNDSGENPEPLRTSPEQPALIPLRPSLLDQLAGSGTDLLTQAAQITHRLNTLLGDDNQIRLQHTLEALEIAARGLVDLERRAGSILERIPAIEGDLHEALKAHSSMAHDVRETSRRFRELADDVGRLASLGRTAGESLIGERMAEWDAMLDDLRRAAASFRKLSKTLEEDPQTLLLGPRPGPPGPGEPGYQEPK